MSTEVSVHQLEALGKALTQRAICRMTGISAGNLDDYPEVSSLVKKAVKEDRAKHIQERRRLREEELIVQVMDVIHYLRGIGKRVTVKAIVRIVRLSVPALNYYPKVKAILEQVIRGEIPPDSDESPSA